MRTWWPQRVPSSGVSPMMEYLNYLMTGPQYLLAMPLQDAKRCSRCSDFAAECERCYAYMYSNRAALHYAVEIVRAVAKHGDIRNQLIPARSSPGLTAGKIYIGSLQNT
jgi:hypothetical protein